jgi:hypothetical protein
MARLLSVNVGNQQSGRYIARTRRKGFDCAACFEREEDVRPDPCRRNPAGAMVQRLTWVN